MILRRLADAITEQNWFTVVLEVLIVVVGIFIGLQVDDWNQGRKDRSTEQQYLERLYADLEATIVEIDRNMEALERRYAQGQTSIRVFQAGELGDVPRTDFEQGIIVSGRMALVAPRLATIDELIASGRLGIIQNPEIRLAIAAAEGEALRRRAYIDFIAERVNLLTQVVFTRIRRYRVEGQANLSMDYDFDELLADKTFQNAHGNMVQLMPTNGQWLADLRGEMARLRDLVATEIGKGSNP